MGPYQDFLCRLAQGFRLATAALTADPGVEGSGETVPATEVLQSLWSVRKGPVHGASVRLCGPPWQLDPAPARAGTRRAPPARRTSQSGCACRLSHQAGLPPPQPFIAIVTRFGPSSKYPTITLRRRPVRRPMAVSRIAPQRLPFGRHSPIRPAVTLYKPRCTDHAQRTIQRGEAAATGSRVRLA